MSDLLTITPDQLRDELLPITHATPISISSFTEVKTRKKNNPFGTIMKLCRRQVFSAFNYELAVNRQLDRMCRPQDFQAQPRSWGRQISPCLIEHLGAFYLRAKIERQDRAIFLYRRSGGYWSPVPYEAIRPFVVEQPENVIEYRNFMLSNLVFACFQGKRFRVRRPDAPIMVPQAPPAKRQSPPELLPFSEERHIMDPDNGEYFT